MVQRAPLVIGPSGRVAEIGLDDSLACNANIVGGTLDGVLIGGTNPPFATLGSLTVGGNLVANPFFAVNGTAGSYRQVQFQTAGKRRWTLAATDIAETGANAGSNLELSGFSDTEAYLHSPIGINRGTGLVTLNRGAASTGGSVNGATIGDVTPAAITGTTLALTAARTASFVLAAPTAAAGAPTWRQLAAADVTGLGTLATTNAATPPALGATTPAAVTATTLTSTAYRYSSGATGLSAAGTTQATATAITKTNSVFATVAAGAGAVLPNLPPVTVGGGLTFAEFHVFNAGANALLLYPATGGTINALAANAALSVAAGAAVRGVQNSATNYRLS